MKSLKTAKESERESGYSRTGERRGTIKLGHLVKTASEREALTSWRTQEVDKSKRPKEGKQGAHTSWRAQGRAKSDSRKKKPAKERHPRPKERRGRVKLRHPKK